MSELREYKNLYLKLSGYLKILVNSRVFYGKESYRENLSKSILDAFPLLKYLSQKSNSSSSEWQSLFDIFKASYRPENVELQDLDFSSKTIEEIADEIHYLWVCVKNICDVDLDKTSEEELAAKERPSDNYPKEPHSIAIYKNFFNTTVDPDPNKSGKIDELVLRSHAWERLKHDIETGSIYIYTTKPKRNVIIKNFLSGLLAGGGFISLMLFFMSVFQISSESSESSESSAFAGILFSSLSGIYCYFAFKQLRKTFENENYKYSFQGNIFQYTLYLSFSMAFSLPFSNFNTSSTFLWYALLSIVALGFGTYLFSFLFLQPKKDQTLIDNILEKHFSDLSKTLAL